ncbi:MAG: hypothetical protein AAF488_09985 [Planctomycetota bacterium]
MKLRALFAIGLSAALLSPTAFAADKDFDQNTILMISTDSVAAMEANGEASQYGAFMNDPQISKLWGHLQTGVVKMFKDNMAQSGMSEEDRAEFDKFSGLMFDDYMGAIGEEMKGRFSMALGYRNDASGAMQPNLTFHFQAGDKVDAVHSKLIDYLVEASEGQFSRTTMDIAGVSFQGIAMPSGEAHPMLKMPDGLFFGRKGTEFYVGISKDGLTNYINSSNATGNTAVGNRLGNAAHYMKAVNSAGAGGDMRFFLNLEPLWQFVPLAVQMAAPQDAQEILGMINALGLNNFQGVYATSSSSAAGIASDSFIAIKDRTGLMELLPQPGAAVQMPNFVSKNATQVQVGRMQFDKVLGLVKRLAGTIGGDQARQEIDGGLEQLKMELGVSVEELFASLEGTATYLSLPGEGGAAGMAMLQDPTAMLGRLVVGFKLKDSGPFEKLMTSLISHPAFGSQFKVETFLERKVYSVAGDAPPEFAGSMPTPGMTIDNGWFVLGIQADDLKDALRTASGEASNQLANDPKFKALTSKVGGNGSLIMYQDTGKMLGEAVEMMKMMVGLVAMGLPPEVFENQDLMYVLSPQNMPSGSTMEKYFGHQVGNLKAVDGGLLSKGWAPNAAKKSTKPAPKSTGR